MGKVEMGKVEAEKAGAEKATAALVEKGEELSKSVVH